MIRIFVYGFLVNVSNVWFLQLRWKLEILVSHSS